MIWQIIIAVVTAVFTLTKQQKMKKKMEAEADARKGFKATVKGEPISLPILYGRNKVGAVVTAAKTSSSYTAPSSTPSGAEKWALSGNNGLASSISFSKAKKRRNQFLTVQYAICQDGINKIQDIEVDEQAWNARELQFGQRIHTYTEGGTADTLATSNGLSSSNKFTKCAYATGVFHLDRDDPQYYGIPSVSFYVQGKKVPNISRTGSPGSYVYTYSRTSNLLYTTNPALILLDYMTADYGMGLATSDLNIGSFFDAAAICGSTVNPSNGLGAINKQGKVWSGTGYYSSGYSRLNVGTQFGNSYLSLSATGNASALNVYTNFNNGSGPFVGGQPLTFNTGGGNIYTIPQDASAVGSYNSTTERWDIPLSNVVPDNAQVPTIGTSTELSTEEISIVTIRESYNTDELPLYECNVTLNPAAPIRDNVDEILLSMGNADLIWSEGKYKLQLQYPSSQTVLKTIAENTLVITDDILKTSAIKTSYPRSTERLNQCTVRYNNEQEDFATATATWPSSGSTVHNDYLTEDSGVVLNASLTIGAITDPYHATARAEQFVRESRRLVIYEFECFAEAYSLEPGDYIKFNSELNDLTSDYDTALVTGVELTEQMTVKIEAVRTNASDLAWNTEDEISSPYPEITSFLTLPPSISNSAISEVQLSNASITGYYVDEEKQRVFLRWDGDVFGTQVDKYLVEVRENASTNDDKWVTVGETSNEIIYHVPGNPNNDQYYRVKSISQGGSRSQPSAPIGPVDVTSINLTEGVIPVYADDATGTNKNLARQTGQEFVLFYEWTGSAPSDAYGITGTWVKFVGEDADALTSTSSTANGVTTVTFSDGTSFVVNDGTDGTDGITKGVTPIFASNSSGANQNYTQGSLEYVNYYEYTNTKPTLPVSGLTWVKYIGEDGDSEGVIPIYADDASGTNASFTLGSRTFVNFYEWTGSAPTSVPSGLSYVKFVGEDGETGGSVNIAFTRSNTTPQATGTGTLPTGSGVTWVDDAPTGTALLWAVNGNLASGGTTWSWGNPYQVEGTAVAELYVFRRNATSFTNNGSYNFVTGVLTPPTSWSTTPVDLLADGDTVYVSSALVTGGPTDTSVTPSWSTPKVYAQRTDGEDGEDGADAFNVVLGWTSRVVPRDASGNPDLTGTGNTVTLYRGGALYGSFNVTTSSTNITAGSPGSGNPLSYGAATNWGSTSVDIATIVYTVTPVVSGVNQAAISVTSTFTLAPVGGVGNTGFLFVTSLPAASGYEEGQVVIVEASAGAAQQGYIKSGAQGGGSWVARDIVNHDIIFADAIRADQLEISSSTGSSSGIFMNSTGTNNSIEIYDGTTLRVKIGKL